MFNYSQWRQTIEERLKAKKGTWTANHTGRHYQDDDYWEVRGPDMLIADEFGGILDGPTAQLIINAPEDLRDALNLIDHYRTALAKCTTYYCVNDEYTDGRNCHSCAVCIAKNVLK